MLTTVITSVITGVATYVLCVTISAIALYLVGFRLTKNIIIADDETKQTEVIFTAPKGSHAPRSGNVLARGVKRMRQQYNIGGDG